MYHFKMLQHYNTKCQSMNVSINVYTYISMKKVALTVTRKTSLNGQEGTLRGTRLKMEPIIFNNSLLAQFYNCVLSG